MAASFVRCVALCNVLTLQLYQKMVSMGSERWGVIGAVQLVYADGVWYLSTYILGVHRLNRDEEDYHRFALLAWYSLCRAGNCAGY